MKDQTNERTSGTLTLADAENDCSVTLKKRKCTLIKLYPYLLQLSEHTNARTKHRHSSDEENRENRYTIKPERGIKTEWENICVVFVEESGHNT